MVNQNQNPDLRQASPALYLWAVEMYLRGAALEEIVEGIYDRTSIRYSTNTVGDWGARERVKYGGDRREAPPPLPSLAEITEATAQVAEEAGQSDEEHEASLQQHLRELAQKHAQQYQERRLRELASTEIWTRRVLDLLRDTAAAIPAHPVTIPHMAPSNQGEGAERVCAFALSDVQAGIVVDPKEVGDRFNYNSTMLAERFRFYEERVWQFIDEQRLIGPVTQVSFWVPGDLVENHTKRPKARLDTDMALTTATITLARILTDFTIRMRSRYPQIALSWDFLPGNHDAIGKPGDDKTYDNWAIIIAEMLRISFEGDETVTIVPHTTEYAILQYGAASVMLHHGHGVGGAGGLLPWYGIDRKVGRWEGFHRQQFRYVVIGHFHNPAMWQTNTGCKVYVNGAWFSTTAFGNTLGLATEPQQLAFALTEADGIVYQREIMLIPQRHAATPALPRSWATA